MKRLFKTLAAGLKGSRKSRPDRRAILGVESLEARQLLSASPITDMTQLANLFTPHSAPTVLYVNFGGTGGAAIGGETVAAYQATPGGNRTAEINAVTAQVSEIFAPFRLEVVSVDKAGWYDGSSQGNTTIFVGADAKNVDTLGNKVTHGSTPAAYVDAPGINKGYSHQPHSDPFNLAFMDPVGQVRPGLWATQLGAVAIAQGVAHEAGHTFGLEDVLSNPVNDVMSYDAGNQQFVDRTFSVTDFNYSPKLGTYHGGDAFYAEWKEANGTIDKVTTQDSFTYLQAVLGRSSDQMAVQRNADGREQMFVIGTDHAVWTRAQVTPGGAWGGWGSLGGYVVELAAARNAGGKLELFGIGSDHQVYRDPQATLGGGFAGWSSIGAGYVTQIAVGANADGRLEVFGIGADHQLYQNTQYAPGPITAYTGWGNSLGGYVKQVTVASNVDGRLEVFMIGGENALWSRKQVTPGGALGGWTFLDGYVKQIAVGVTQWGWLDVYAIGGDNEVYHRQQSSPSGGYNGWVNLGGSAKQITVGTNHDGRMEVFAITTADTMAHLWQSAPGHYGAWSNLGGIGRQIALGTNADGSLDVFAVGSGEDTYHNVQSSPGSLFYSGWKPLGGSVV